MFLVKQYILYILRCVFKTNQQSEFTKDFIVNVLKKKIDITKENQISRLKGNYYSKDVNLQIEDYGAGTRKKVKSKKIEIDLLLKNVSVRKKYGQVLYHLSNFYKTTKCIELGTSLGIGSTYLSNKQNTVISIEGNKSVASLAANSLKELNIDNINIVNSKFDDVLPSILKENSNFDLIFIDGNHSQEATLRYFEMILEFKNNNSIIVFDDIYWSFGMKNAWNTIRVNKNVKLSIDLFQFGIIFFNNNLKEKEHHTLWY